MSFVYSLHVTCVFTLFFCICYAYNVNVPARTSHRHTSTTQYAKKKEVSTAEKVQRYIQMRELKKLREGGGSYDEVKEFMINGTARQGSFDNVGADVQVKRDYKKVMGKGSLEQRLRAIVALKRENAGIEAMSQSDSGLTSAEESELEEMMESDEYDDDDIWEDEEEAEYESLVLKAIEMNKLNELKRNFLVDKGMRREEMEELASNNTKFNTNDITVSSSMSMSSTTTTTSSSSSSMTSSSSSSTTTTSSSSSSSTTSTTTTTKTTKSTGYVAEEDLYVPARSSWGVFERPRDISRTFGGGRSISKAEMDKMDQEWEENERRIEIQQRSVLDIINKKEKDNGEKIRSALSKSRAYMGVGNRKAAVETLQNVQELISWQTDLGGQVQLEYAMALETVDRSDEARQIYGKLSVVSWSSKIKGQAVQLLQGLEITKQIRKDITPSKPFMDMANMYAVSEALKPGLRNEWDEYDSDKKKRYYKVNPWYDEPKSALSSSTPPMITRVVTLSDAYIVLTRALNPLKSVERELLYQAFKRMILAMDFEKMSLLKARGLVKAIPNSKQSNTFVTPPTSSLTSSSQTKMNSMTSVGGGSSSSSSSSSSSTTTTSSSSGYTGGSTFQNAISTMTGGLYGDANTATTTTTTSSMYYNKKTEGKNNKNNAATPIYDATTSLSNIYLGNLNGTWDLILSLSIDDIKPSSTDDSLKSSRFKRYEQGNLRRYMTLDGRTTIPSCTEISPVMWGLSEVKHIYNVLWNDGTCSASFDGSQVLRSNAPWQRKNQETQSFEVIYCDDAIKVTRQATDVTEPSMYTLWKRVLPTVWKKY